MSAGGTLADPRHWSPPSRRLVQPPPPPSGCPPDRPAAYDITVRSPYAQTFLRQAALQPAGAAELADTAKLQGFLQTVRDALSVPPNADPSAHVEWHFVNLAFDTLGALSKRTERVLDPFGTRIEYKSQQPFQTAKLVIQQRLSYVVWSTDASSPLSCLPVTLRAVFDPHPCNVRILVPRFSTAAKPSLITLEKKICALLRIPVAGFCWVER